MPTINISVNNKIATPSNAVVVCKNTDYTIDFNFDDEWNGYEAKTARFIWNGRYVDVAFAGHSVTMPAIDETLYVAVGVYSGNLHTTTPAILTAKKSILCGSEQPHPEPPEDVYNQIIALINQLPGALGAAQDAREAADEASQSAQTAIQYAALAEGSATESAESASAAAGSADRSEDAAQRAEQVATLNGYAEFEIGDDGHIYVTRTDNIADELDFELVGGRLVAIIG